MKKKIFKYKFVYWLALFYSLIVFMAYLYINLTQNYLKNGFNPDSIYHLMKNNFVFISATISIFLLIRKSFKSQIFINIYTILLVIFLLGELWYYYNSDEVASYFQFTLVVLIFNVLVLFLVNKYILKEFSTKEIDKIGEKEI